MEGMTLASLITSGLRSSCRGDVEERGDRVLHGGRVLGARELHQRRDGPRAHHALRLPRPKPAPTRQNSTVQYSTEQYSTVHMALLYRRSLQAQPHIREKSVSMMEVSVHLHCLQPLLLATRSPGVPWGGERRGECVCVGRGVFGTE